MATKPKRMPTHRVDEVDDAGFSFAKDDEAEAFGEEFVATATSGEFIGEDARNEPGDDELVDVTAMYEEEEELDAP